MAHHTVAGASAPPKADFGSPVTTTDYQFCLYAGGVLVSRAYIPAGGTCGAGKPCWKANAKGANIDMPAMPLAQPVRVQLRNSAGVCWDTTHSAPASKNDGAQHKDKND